jgi:prephenate dehydrogenase
MNLQEKTIGIIGFGNFGKVICSYIFPKNKVVLFSNHLDLEMIPKNCSKAESIADLVTKSDIIIPAVPIKKFEEVIKAISKEIRKEQIVIDICSVMEFPAEVMVKNLPASSKILATHPMFGPNSIQRNNNSTKGLKIVMSNISLNKDEYDLFKEYFLNLNLEIIEMSPAKHDELSAKSQFFALLVGQIAQSLNLKKTQIDTPGANAIFDSLSYMGSDREIIEDMITYNRFCAEVHGKTIDLLKGLKI